MSKTVEAEVTFFHSNGISFRLRDGTKVRVLAESVKCTNGEEEEEKPVFKLLEGVTEADIEPHKWGELGTVLVPEEFAKRVKKHIKKGEKK